MFINALRDVTRKNGESYLEDEHIKRIADAYHSKVTIDNFSRLVDVNEIASYDFDLSIQKYVFLPKEDADTLISLDEASKAYLNAQKQIDASVSELLKLVAE